MATYAQLRDSGTAKPAWWCEWSGIPYAWGSSKWITASAFNDGYTETLTHYPLLLMPGDLTSKRIDILSADATGGGLSVTFVDEGIGSVALGKHEGFFTWLLGWDRSSIVRTNFRSDVLLHAGGVGHSWPVASTAAFGASGTIFAGLESGIYTAKTGGATPSFDNVTRSAWKSEAVAHKGRPYGTTTIYEEVTDHPTEFAGRIVTLFQTYVDPAGNLATTDGTKAGCRAAAKRFRGILVDTSMSGRELTVRCDPIDKLLDRMLMRAPARARVSPRVYVYSHQIDRVGGDGAVMLITQDDGAGNTETWHIGITAINTYMDEETFLREVNDALNPAGAGIGGGPFYGQLTVSSGNNETIFRYTPDAANPRAVVINLREHTSGTHTTGEYWEGLGLIAGNDSPNIILNELYGSAEVEASVMRGPYAVIFGGDQDQNPLLEIMQGPDDSPISDFTTPAGENFVALEYGGGVEIVECLVVTPAAKTILVRRQSNWDQVELRPPVVGTPDSPVYIRRIYVANSGPGMLTTSTMQLLLSSGLAAYNDANYDTLPEGVGLAIPSETVNAGAATSDGLINVSAFETFFAEAQVYLGAFPNGVLDILLEPTSAREWLAKRVGFFNGHLTVENGQISVRKGLGVSRSDARSMTFLNQKGQTRRDATHKGYTKGIKYRWGYQYETGLYRYTAFFSFKHIASNPENKWLEREDQGVRMSVDGVRMLAEELLAEVSLPGAILHVQANALVSDIEVGTVLIYSDEGSDNLKRPLRGMATAQGLRGHSQTATLVIGARGKPGIEVQLDLLETRGKKGGYSSSAWINTLAIDTPVANTTRLSCKDQFFSPAGEGADVTRFVVGEKVRVVRISCTTGGVRQSTGHTITAINTSTNAIEIQPNVAGAGIVSGETLILMHDSVWDATQPQTAKNWAGVGDSSGDIDDVSTELCYDW